MTDQETGEINPSTRVVIFGDDVIVDYPGPVNGNVVEDDVISEENN